MRSSPQPKLTREERNIQDRRVPAVKFGTTLKRKPLDSERLVSSTVECLFAAVLELLLELLPFLRRAILPGDGCGETVQNISEQLISESGEQADLSAEGHNIR